MIQKKEVICENCDLVLSIPYTNNGKFIGICPRCHKNLYHYNASPYIFSLCYAITALIFVITTDLLPFISISLSGIYQSMQILDFIKVMIDDNYLFFTIFIFVLMQVIPILCLLIIISTDLCIIYKKPLRILENFQKIYNFCISWSMADVFLVGVLVSLIKLVSLVEVGYGLGFWCFILFVIFYILSLSFFDKEFVWEFIKPKEMYQPVKVLKGITISGQNLKYCKRCFLIQPKENKKCERCGMKSDLSLKNSRIICFAMLLTAFIMYIPANVYPIMITTYLGSTSPSTIIDGVIELWEMESYFVSIVIVVASIIIPLFKIFTLLYLCISTYYFSRTLKKRKLTILYRFVEFIGKWSMIDVFVVAIMSTIVKVDNLMTIDPGNAILPFTIVVILTMIAARIFNSKYLWIKDKD